MYQYSYLVEQVEVLLSQFEWKSRDSPTETRLTDRYRSTDSLSFVTPANFPRVVTVRRMANDITYTMYAALPIHYVYNLWCVRACACVRVCVQGLKMRQVRQLCLDQLKAMSNEVILDCVEPQKPQESLNVDAAVLELLGPSNTASEGNKTSSTVDNSDVGTVKVGGGESGVGGEQSGDVKESSDISGRELQSEEGSPTQTVECDTTTSDISREDAEHISRGDSGKEDITSREDFDKDHTSRDREREEGHSGISKEGSGRRDSSKERGEIVKDGTSRGDTSRGDETREEDAMEEVAESEGESSSGSDLEDFWLCDFPEEVSEWARLQEIEFRRRALEAELRRRGEGGEGVKGMSVGGCEGDKVDKSEAIELQLRQRALQSLLAKKQELQK